MLIKRHCVIRYDEIRQCWVVCIGVSMVHFGTLFSCEEWARMSNLPVRNQEEINRVKYSNMPVQEMFT